MPLALVMGTAGVAFAVRDARVRALFGLSAAAVSGYGIVFRGGAEMHDYWNFALLVPLAVAASAGFDHLARAASPTRRNLVVVGSLLVAAACLTISVTQPSSAQYALENGVGTVELARVAEGLPHEEGGPVLAYLSTDGALWRWIDYETGSPGIALQDTADLARLADRAPDLPVLVVLVKSSEAVRALLEANAFAIEGPYGLVPASVANRARS
jgi:hypothetical protein